MKFNYSAKKVMIGVLFLYFLVVFFSYFYFMTIDPITTGAAIYSDFDGSVIKYEEPIIVKTIITLLIIVLIFIFVYVIPRFLFKKFLKNEEIVTPKYKPFKSL